MDGNGRPEIIDEKKDKIRTIFNRDLRKSLRIATTQVDLHHMTIWIFLKRELK